ncbi:DNA-binding FrmR family transcriptional regulator [Salinicoccus halitifaciens]|uniref:DNA-binding FrmR family transcriptional regulator n=2 Tax=Salinicoccus halitifaciens TaxID=1073415 RepID=A0ABV2E9P5_9STAP
MMIYNTVYNKFWKVIVLTGLEEKTVYDKAVINRISRLQGQINGALKMMEEGKNCKDVVTQLSAAKNALNRTMNIIVSENLVQCVKETMNNPDEDTDELVKEAVELLNKSR